MYQVKYQMDMKRYRQWTCPPVTKTRGFWFWLVLLVVSTAALVYFRSIESEMRFQSLAALLILCSLYRGFFFRPMYANKQFRLMRMQYGKEAWDSQVDIDDEGIRTYMDGEQQASVTWDQVESFTVTTNYFDFEVDKDFIRLPRDCFTEGSDTAFLQWMDEQHAAVPRKQESKEFAN
ncbi:MAG: YcxB family protein [Oscillospiraceae bacterium]